MVDVISFPHEDYPPDHAAADKVLKCIGGQSFQLVPRTFKGRAADCYNNCLVYTSNHGGSVVQGWSIEWLPDLYITAIHHAVVKTASGDLIDVTEPQFHGTPCTTFVIDLSIKQDLAKPIPVMDKYVMLSDDKDLSSAVRYYLENLSSIKRMTMVLYDDPRYRHIPGSGFEGPPFHEEYPDIARDMKESHRKTHRYRRRVLRRYLQG